MASCLSRSLETTGRGERNGREMSGKIVTAHRRNGTACHMETKVCSRVFSFFFFIALLSKFPKPPISSSRGSQVNALIRNIARYLKYHHVRAIFPRIFASLSILPDLGSPITLGLALSLSAKRDNDNTADGFCYCLDLESVHERSRRGCAELCVAK